MSRRRAAGPILALMLLMGSLTVVATVAPAVIDRVVHRHRYATSGRARLPVAAYLAAAREMANGRVARLALPLGEGPVSVEMWPATEVFLDPPTARVLEVVRGSDEDGEGAGPIVGAQPVASVIVRATPYGDGGRLHAVVWPTRRSPDWTLGFGDAGVRVKVADDSGTARPAPVRAPNGAARLAHRLEEGSALGIGWRVAILLGGIAGVVLAAAAIVRRWRRSSVVGGRAVYKGIAA